VLGDALLVIGHENSFHPVKDYFSSLKWDGTRRIDNWLTAYATVDESEYSQAIGAIVLTAAVRRIKQPGCLFQEMLVFESPLQGTEKSTAIASLCPESEWFTDGLKLNMDAKEIIERTSGKWIIEAGELAGMRKTDTEHLKSFLSRQVDEARLAWGRFAAIRPRQFIQFGTTNTLAWLKDQTGNRRFWPVRVNVKFDVASLRRDRDQLWAEAVEREASGCSIRLDPKLWAYAEIEQSQRLIKDPWLSILEEAFGKIEGKIPCSEVWKLLDINEAFRKTQQDASRIGSVMQTLGFEHKRLRVDGELRWVYARGKMEVKNGQPWTPTIYLMMNDHGHWATSKEPPTKITM
jgi:predicted P-loop ATPase